MTERLLHLFTVLATAAGLGLLVGAPQLLILGWGHPLLSGVVHLLTLGGVLGAALLLQHRLWVTLYGAAAPWTPLLVGVAAFQAGGVVLFSWGLFAHDPWLAYLGGHYGVPTGIGLALLHGIIAARRRPPGRSRYAVAHLPGLGLAVAMSIGALLVMDAYDQRYDVYTPATILAHLLAAGFLFVLPQALLPQALLPQALSPQAQRQSAQLPASAASDPAGDTAGDPAGEPAGDPTALLRWYALSASGALGVLLVTLALAGQGPARMLPLGLASLGALLVWLGLPSAQQMGRRGGPRAGGVRLPHGADWAPLAGRLATGVLLFYAALRAAQGPAAGDAFWLAKVGALLFIAGIALPDLLAALEVIAGVRGTAWRRMAGLLGTAVLLAGQVWALPLLVQAGALVWLATVLWHGAAWQQAALRGPARGPAERR